MGGAGAVALDDPDQPPVLGCESCGLVSANAFAASADQQIGRAHV